MYACMYALKHICTYYLHNKAKKLQKKISTWLEPPNIVEI